MDIFMFKDQYGEEFRDLNSKGKAGMRCGGIINIFL